MHFVKIFNFLKYICRRSPNTRPTPRRALPLRPTQHHGYQTRRTTPPTRRGPLKTPVSLGSLPAEVASNPVPETPPIFSECPAATLPRHAPRRRRGSGLAHGRPGAAGPTARTRTARLASRAYNELSTGVSGSTLPHPLRRHATQPAQCRIITQRRNQQDIPPEGHESPAEARPGCPGATAAAKPPPDDGKGLHSYPS